jgi:hypothetical protein
MCIRDRGKGVRMTGATDEPLIFRKKPGPITGVRVVAAGAGVPGSAPLQVAVNTVEGREDLRVTAEADRQRVLLPVASPATALREGLVPFLPDELSVSASMGIMAGEAVQFGKAVAEMFRLQGAAARMAAEAKLRPSRSQQPEIIGGMGVMTDTAVPIGEGLVNKSFFLRQGRMAAETDLEGSVPEQVRTLGHMRSMTGATITAADGGMDILAALHPGGKVDMAAEAQLLFRLAQQARISGDVGSMTALAPPFPHGRMQALAPESRGIVAVETNGVAGDGRHPAQQQAEIPPHGSDQAAAHFDPP